MTDEETPRGAAVRRFAELLHEEIKAPPDVIIYEIPNDAWNRALERLSQDDQQLIDSPFAYGEAAQQAGRLRARARIVAMLIDRWTPAEDSE